MALIWAEGFDTFGSDNNLFVSRGYTANNLGVLFNVVSNAPEARTGTGFLRFNGSFNDRWVSRAINSTDVVGSGIGIKWLNANGSPQSPGLRFGSGASNRLIFVTLMTDLSIGVYSNGVLIGQSPANTVNLNTYYWLETRVRNNNAVSGNPLTISGQVEVRINGVAVLSISGVNLPNPFIEVSLGQRGEGLSAGGSIDLDDWIIWDNSGTFNNDFLGDRRCWTSYPNADTALEQWTPSTGTDSFAILDNAPPIDTQFLQANMVGNISEFGVQPIGINSNDVAAVVITARAAKVDAGTATFRIGINSAGSVLNSAPQAPNVNPSFSYFTFIAERNPNGNIPWTRTTFNAALARITREA